MYKDGKQISQPGLYSNVLGDMEAQNDTVIFDVKGLTRMMLAVDQTVDAGTATIVLEGSLDGTNWFSLNANLSEASFPAGNNKSVLVSLSDANAMPKLMQQIRITLSAVTGGGKYQAHVMGLQLEGYR